jgi:PKD repeat protein
VGVETEFNASGSYSPNGEIVSYEWDLYGGGFSPGGSSATAVYNTAGTYTVRLRVTDELGLEMIGTTTITVEVIPEYDSSLPFGTKAPIS